MMVDFIRENRTCYGVESICEVLPIGRSTSGKPGTRILRYCRPGRNAMPGFELKSIGCGVPIARSTECARSGSS